MDGERNVDIVSVEDIAEEFKIPFLSEMIAYNKKVTVNMNHISGRYESDGEPFIFKPVVEFHPLKDGSGFKFLIFDIETSEAGLEMASVSTFRSTSDCSHFEVDLDDEDYIAEERIIVTPEISEFDPERFPAGDVQGYDNNPFKILSVDPTLE